MVSNVVSLKDHKNKKAREQAYRSYYCTDCDETHKTDYCPCCNSTGLYLMDGQKTAGNFFRATMEDVFGPDVA